MNIVSDGDSIRPEIQLSGSPSRLREIGQILFEVETEVEIQSTQEKSEFYPENLNKLVVKRKADFDPENLLSISVSQGNLLIEGTEIALRDLGQSLLNCFDEGTPDRYHIHFDYYEGHDLIAPTNCSLIVICFNK